MKRTVEQESQEEKCLQAARNRVQFHKKWGKWRALVYLILSLLLFGAGVLLVRVVQTIGRGDPQKVQDAERLGLAVGMLIGFMAGFAFFKGAMCLVESIKSLRGDLADRLLVEYHDGLVALLNDPASQASDFSGIAAKGPEQSSPGQRPA